MTYADTNYDSIAYQLHKAAKLVITIGCLTQWVTMMIDDGCNNDNDGDNDDNGVNYDRSIAHRCYSIWSMIDILVLSYKYTVTYTLFI